MKRDMPPEMKDALPFLPMKYVRRYAGKVGCFDGYEGKSRAIRPRRFTLTSR